jgi:hypothetical protein
MTATPPTLDRTPARRELLAVWSTGALMAAGLGLAVALFRGEQFWLVFGVFTACFLAPCFGLAWLVLGPGRRVAPDPHADENVESHWFEKAGSGALFDTMAVIGIAVGVLSLFELEADAALVLMGVWVFALADGVLRYTLLARREA